MFPYLADENVRRELVTALRLNGYEAVYVEDYGKGDSDEEILRRALRDQLVILTNDDDFVKLAQKREHAGIIRFKNQTIDPGKFVRAIRTIEEHYSREEMFDHVEWLEQWLRL